jgi:hypothetical protein
MLYIFFADGRRVFGSENAGRQVHPIRQGNVSESSSSSDETSGTPTTAGNLFLMIISNIHIILSITDFRLLNKSLHY